GRLRRQADSRDGQRRLRRRGAGGAGRLRDDVRGGVVGGASGEGRGPQPLRGAAPGRGRGRLGPVAAGAICPPGGAGPENEGDGRSVGKVARGRNTWGGTQ